MLGDVFIFKFYILIKNISYTCVSKSITWALWYKIVQFDMKTFHCGGIKFQ